MISVLDKDQVWKDLAKMTKDSDKIVRMEALKALQVAFSSVSDKDQCWKDLVKMANDRDRDVRGAVVEALQTAFSSLPNLNSANMRNKLGF